MDKRIRKVAGNMDKRITKVAGNMDKRTPKNMNKRTGVLKDSLSMVLP